MNTIFVDIFRKITHSNLIKFEDDVTLTYNITQIKYFYNIIFESTNLSDFDIQTKINIYIKAKAYYNSLQKFAYKIKVKTAKEYENSNDLCGNLFTEISNKITYNYFDIVNRINYKFRLSDLINIINNSLSYSPNFFADPQQIKNPYTNTPFKLSDLYNIYYRLKNSPYIMPTLFHQYFNTNFNLIKFTNENECYIRDYNIFKILTHETSMYKYKLIIDMLNFHSAHIDINISPFFPKQRLVDIFLKPYLKLYLLQQYSLNPMIKYTSNENLTNLLQRFTRLNPDFGKGIVILKRLRDNSMTTVYRFNTIVNAVSPIITPNESPSGSSPSSPENSIPVVSYNYTELNNMQADPNNDNTIDNNSDNYSDSHYDDYDDYDDDDDDDAEVEVEVED